MAKLFSAHKSRPAPSGSPSSPDYARNLFHLTYREGEDVDGYIARLAACYGEDNPIILAHCRRLANDAAWCPHAKDN